jgi:hypothetical protein
MQNTALAVQAVLPLKDVPIGTSLVTFMQTIGQYYSIPFSLPGSES